MYCPYSTCTCTVRVSMHVHEYIECRLVLYECPSIVMHKYMSIRISRHVHVHVHMRIHVLMYN